MRPGPFRLPGLLRGLFPGRDDLAALGLADGDRLVVAPGGPAGQRGQFNVTGVVQVVPFLLDPADQIYLVVHGQAEEH